MPQPQRQLKTKGNFRVLKKIVKASLKGAALGDVSLTAIYLRRIVDEYELSGRRVPLRLSYTLAQFEKFLGYRVK